VIREKAAVRCCGPLAEAEGVLLAQPCLAPAQVVGLVDKLCWVEALRSRLEQSKMAHFGRGEKGVGASRQGGWRALTLASVAALPGLLQDHLEQALAQEHDIFAEEEEARDEVGESEEGSEGQLLEQDEAARHEDEGSAAPDEEGSVIDAEADALRQDGAGASDACSEKDGEEEQGGEGEEKDKVAPLPSRGRGHKPLLEKAGLSDKATHQDADAGTLLAQADPEAARWESGPDRPGPGLAEIAAHGDEVGWEDEVERVQDEAAYMDIKLDLASQPQVCLHVCLHRTLARPRRICALGGDVLLVNQNYPIGASE
jgi:hypothetical protein